MAWLQAKGKEMSWAKLDLTKGKYHYFENCTESLCGLKCGDKHPIVTHSVVKNKGKCVKCLRLSIKNEKMSSLGKSR